jgi:hypothetical protein
MSVDLGRALPNARMRLLLLAIQDVVGRGGLMTVLRQARLQRFTDRTPLYDQHPQINAVEYSAAIQAIEHYYGRGARGTLIRVGQAFHRQLRAHHAALAQFRRLSGLVLPLRQRQRWALTWLAETLAAPSGRVEVTPNGGGWLLLDHECDSGFGRRSEAPSCWVTLGAIQEALVLATGHDHDITEVSCKTTGDPVCRFEIAGLPV